MLVSEKSTSLISSEVKFLLLYLLLWKCVEKPFTLHHFPIICKVFPYCCSSCMLQIICLLLKVLTSVNVFGECSCWCFEKMTKVVKFCWSQHLTKVTVGKISGFLDSFFFPDTIRIMLKYRSKGVSTPM